MAMVTFSDDDIKRAKLVTPGRYSLLVKNYELALAGTDQSELYVYTILVVQPGGPFDGVPIRYQISEKAIGMGIEFFEACGFEIKPGIKIETEKAVGKKVEGFVQRGEYKGKGNNQIAAFYKPKAA